MSNCHLRHIVLSPHLDDAPLSCGGSIHRWASADEPVLVITVMTGDPPAGPHSPFAEYQHASWGVSAAEAFAIRRSEEAAALGRLGASYTQLGLLDCIYRGDNAGFFYTSEEAIFGSVHPADEPLIDTLTQRLAGLEPFAPGAAVYSPLGLGDHIDHQLVRRAAERWRGRDLLYYEDYPYAYRMRLDRNEIQRGEPGLVSRRVWLTEGDVRAKIEAIGRYRSQMGILFGGYSQMEAGVWAYGRAAAGGNGWAERFWHPIDTPALGN
jgi:LmbE family N-acetylglucosaminyl deacetylase